MERDFQAEVDLFRDHSQNRRTEIEEQGRAIAPEEYSDLTPTDLLTIMVLEHIELGGYAGRFYGSDLWAPEQLGKRIRNAVELEFVQAVDPEKSPLLLHIAFAAMEEVDWIDVAMHTRDMIIEEQQRMHELMGADSPVKPLLTSYEVDPEKMEELLKRVKDRKM